MIWELQGHAGQLLETCCGLRGPRFQNAGFPAFLGLPVTHVQFRDIRKDVTGQEGEPSRWSQVCLQAGVRGVCDCGLELSVCQACGSWGTAWDELTSRAPSPACRRPWAPLHPPFLAQEGHGTHASVGLDTAGECTEPCSPPEGCPVSMWAAVALQAGQAEGSALAALPTVADALPSLLWSSVVWAGGVPSSPPPNPCFTKAFGAVKITPRCCPAPLSEATSPMLSLLLDGGHVGGDPW